MRLAYTTITDKDGRRRHQSLPQVEEMQIAARGPEYVLAQMHPLLIDLSQVTAVGGAGYQMHPEFFRLNSLIWIWVQMKPELVQSNIRILMACNDIHSLNELAKRLKMSAPFTARMMRMKGPVDFGGWNTDNTFKFAHILGARPELMLQVNLKQTVWDEVVDWQV